MSERIPADICLVLEGTYPYVQGGVSSWTHDLIRQHPHLTFHLLCLMPSDALLVPCYELPDNVIGKTDVTLQKLAPLRSHHPVPDVMQTAARLTDWMQQGSLDTFRELILWLGRYPALREDAVWFRDEFGWKLLKTLYDHWLPGGAFVDFFWTWKITMASLMSVLSAPIPPARSYHALCTGYAGLYMARASLETGAPCLVTEHGIYTNERNIEIAAAEWLDDGRALNLAIAQVEDEQPDDLKTFLMRFFRASASTAYAQAKTVVTLFEDNKPLQIADGADPRKLQVIPNGIDTDQFDALEPVTGKPPTVALIGRVVPIKDVKTFIRSVNILKRHINDVRALVVGGADEDPEYAQECTALVESLGLAETLQFTGRQKLTDVLPQVDVMVLTSLSESQPLVILEAGAARIPFVATNVGSCRELIMGASWENPPLGAGGMVCPLGSPQAIASAMQALLGNETFRLQCADALYQRVHTWYRRERQQEAYATLYAQILAGYRLPDTEGDKAWPV